MDKITELAVKDVVGKYNPHTVIIYGSRARGDANIKSDVDIACFVDKPTISEDIREFNGVIIDNCIYSTESMKKVSEFIKFDIAFCPKDKRGLGKQLLEEVKARIQKGPELLNTLEIQNIVNLRLKTLSRANKDDIEGHFRRNWLQLNLLETYFKLNGLWYLGPKNSFSWLQKNDQKAFELFSIVYKSPQDYEALKRLTYHVLNI